MSCLALSELSQEQRDAIARLEVMRMQRVVDQITASLPASEPSPLDGGVSPGAAVAGNLSLEKCA